jgi:hypothetical protein
MSQIIVYNEVVLSVLRKIRLRVVDLADQQVLAII